MLTASFIQQRAVPVSVPLSFDVILWGFIHCTSTAALPALAGDRQRHIGSTADTEGRVQWCSLQGMRCPESRDTLHPNTHTTVQPGHCGDDKRGNFVIGPWDL